MVIHVFSSASKQVFAQLSLLVSIFSFCSSYKSILRCGGHGRGGENTYVKNVLLVNPWKGIDASTHQCPRHWFENVYSQPLSMGI
jgi:hypothetical protein